MYVVSNPVELISSKRVENQLKESEEKVGKKRNEVRSLSVG
jgi:hypothetical protein